MVHGCASVNLVSKYLIAVAVIQCLLAVLIDLVPFVKDVVNSYVVGFASMYSAGEGLEKAGRLYGIGAALDVAGTRFCVILSIIGIMIYETYQLNNKKQTILYLILFVILLVIGSMISRTTGIGLIFICLYMIFMFRYSKTNIGLYGIITISLIALITVVLILYNTNTFFNENLRFAFEGLFNYLETGQWRLSSTDTLQEMYVFPESLKTWIIGDGYFNEPYYYDPYYVGITKNNGLFYMGTDVGYIRFIYYFGVSGLLAFIMYFIVNAYHCVSDFPKKKWIFFAILMMNFIVWFKVATDIFCIFALFLCITKEENDESEKSIVVK